MINNTTFERRGNRRLLRTPQPYPDESLKGLIVRAAEVNGYDSSSSLLNLAGMRGYLSVKGFVMNWKTLSIMLNINVATLKDMAYWGHVPADKRQTTYDFFGHLIPKYHVRATQPKVCPACLRESNYLRKVGFGSSHSLPGP